MTPEDLEALSDDELRATIEQAQSLLQDRQHTKKRDAIEQARATLAAAGLSFQDALSGNAGRPRPRVKEQAASTEQKLSVGDVYTNPANPSQSWTVGRGRKPNWMVELQSTGRLPAPSKRAGES